MEPTLDSTSSREGASSETFTSFASSSATTFAVFSLSPRGSWMSERRRRGSCASFEYPRSREGSSPETSVSPSPSSSAADAATLGGSSFSPRGSWMRERRRCGSCASLEYPRSREGGLQETSISSSSSSSAAAATLGGSSFSPRGFWMRERRRCGSCASLEYPRSREGASSNTAPSSSFCCCC